jgi:hypothetical protein
LCGGEDIAGIIGTQTGTRYARRVILLFVEVFVRGG